MDRKTKAKRKQFLSIYLPSIIVQTPTLAKARIEDKKFIEDFDDIINSAVKECVNKVDGMKIKNYGKENQATRTMFDNVNHILSNAISAIRDSK